MAAEKNNKKSAATQSAGPEVLITRIFDAPREAVFDAWTDREQLMRWYAPPGCQISFRTLDLRPGGAFHSCILTPDGHECWCKGVYLEIARPERIVYTMVIANERGDSIGPTDAGMDPAWPRETVLTVTFAEQEGKTKLTLRQTVDESLAKRTGAQPSWLLMLDRLADELRS
jgi:uncharacterized protein YndB with AHSA1/START domain